MFCNAAWFAPEPTNSKDHLELLGQRQPPSSAGRRLDEVINAQVRVANWPPVRRSVGLFPDAALIDILPWLTGMLDGLVSDPSGVAENDPRIITFTHGQQGYRHSDDHPHTQSLDPQTTAGVPASPGESVSAGQGLPGVPWVRPRPVLSVRPP